MKKNEAIRKPQSKWLVLMILLRVGPAPTEYVPGFRRLGIGGEWALNTTMVSVITSCRERQPFLFHQ